MPCPATSEIDLIIDSEQKTIRTYCWMYLGLAFAAIGFGIYLHFSTALKEVLSKWAEAVMPGMMVPVAMTHLKRRNTLVAYKIMRGRGQQFDPSDPGCRELKSFVDQEIERRLKA